MARTFWKQLAKYARPNPQQRWIFSQLAKRGFQIYGGTNALTLEDKPDAAIAWHFVLPQSALDPVPYDPCNLIVSIYNAPSPPSFYGSKVAFRLHGSTDIHIKRVLVLGTRDGIARLDDFIALYRRIGRCSSNRICDADTIHDERDRVS